VFAFPDLTADEAETLLEAAGERQDPSPDLDLGAEWVVDDCLYARVERDGAQLWADWAPKEVDRLDRQLGRLPTWGLVIDVSGRVDGRAEVTRLLRRLLATGGVALDDYSEHAWSLQEIEAGTAAESRSFLHPA
jgi:hypothetical protein